MTFWTGLATMLATLLILGTVVRLANVGVAKAQLGSNPPMARFDSARPLTLLLWVCILPAFVGCALMWCLIAPFLAVWSGASWLLNRSLVTRRGVPRSAIVPKEWPATDFDHARESESTSQSRRM